MSGGSILIVDDDEGFRAWVSAVLVRAGLTTSEAASGEEALAAVRRDRPALVLLDIALPDMSGYEICRELRDEFGEILRITFVSGARTDRLDRIAGLLVGADDYLVKPIDPDELLARIRRALAQGGIPLRDSKEMSLLTKREREVLALLAEGLTQAQIAGRLYISGKTVSTHIQHVLAKLDVHSRAQAVAVAHRAGLTESTPVHDSRLQ